MCRQLGRCRPPRGSAADTSAAVPGAAGAGNGEHGPEGSNQWERIISMVRVGLGLGWCGGLDESMPLHTHPTQCTACIDPSVAACPTPASACQIDFNLTRPNGSGASGDEGRGRRAALPAPLQRWLGD